MLGACFALGINRHNIILRTFISCCLSLPSISRNGINQITLNKQIGNHLNLDIINVPIYLSSFPFGGCFQSISDQSIADAGKMTEIPILMPRACQEFSKRGEREERK
jgi:hypothetical protein